MKKLYYQSESIDRHTQPDTWTHLNKATRAVRKCSHSPLLITRNEGILRIRDPNPLIIRIIDTIKPLQPYLTQYEIKTLARGGPDISDDEVDRILLATNGSVESVRPTLRIRRELKGVLQSRGMFNFDFPKEIQTYATNNKVERLQDSEVFWGYAEETDFLVKRGLRSLLVFLECIRGDEQEGCA